MSIRKTESNSVPKERSKTDKSLGAERAKADESLIEGRKSAENRADMAILTDRIKGDQRMSRTRSNADDSRDLQRAAPGGSKPSEHLDAEKYIAEERQIADEALETERRHMDAILERERGQNQTAERVSFQNERTRTDKDLTNERSQIDVEVKRAVAELTTREEFLAIVSHDLRNPLASISMAADILISNKIYSSVDSEVREYFDMIARNASEAVRLIGDLMDMERIAAGKLGLQFERHDIDEIIQHSVKAFLPQSSDKNITLQFASTTKTVVMCDRGRISQVLSNLIGNALKFTPSSGVVTLAVQAEDNSVKVSVADTGAGIPEDMRKVIFDRFWQIGKHDRRGLGLGLYISKMILDAHRGRLWADSTLGQGSTFYFTLPLEQH